MNQKLKLLLIENDEDKIQSIKNHLGGEFYEIDSSKSLPDSLEKLAIGNNSIESIEYEVIVLNIGEYFPLQKIIDFFKEIRAKGLDKPNCSFIIFKNVEEEDEGIAEILVGKPFCFISKNDYSNDLYKLEQAIVTMAPRAFYSYRKKIETCISQIAERENATDALHARIDIIDKETKKIDGLNSAQDELKKSQDEFEKKYVSWEKIIESLGILVGAFSLIMAIILAWLFNLSKNVVDIGCLQVSFVEFLVYGFLIFILWAWIFYAILKNRIKRMIDKVLHEKKKDLP